MEVHHHSHAGPEMHRGGKKWTHYFWEFIMLFLAVFCGFLAEYQLEHKIEKDRAKELAKSFYQELKEDSAMAVVKVKNRLKQEESIGYLIRFLKDSSLENVSKEFSLHFLYGIVFRSPTLFEPRVMILEQLKNSGSLRYFKNDELQRLIGDLTVTIRNIYDRQELESRHRMQYLDPLIINHYDYDFDARVKQGDRSIFEAIEKYESSDEIIPYRINELQKLDRSNSINVLAFYKVNVISSTRITFIERYRKINAALLRILREEYHLK